MLDCGPLGLPCTVVEARKHTRCIGDVRSCTICQLSQFANGTQVRLVLHNLYLLSTERTTGFSRRRPRTMGVFPGAQSSIPKSLSISTMYWRWESVMVCVERSRLISTPRNQLVGPRSRSLNRFRSSALICWMPSFVLPMICSHPHRSAQPPSLQCCPPKCTHTAHCAPS
jgi:hypothetical protein